MESARPLSIVQPTGNAGPGYREAPHNTEAEQALLGAILVNNAAYGRVSDFLTPEHFYNPAHQGIYAAIVRLIERGQIADPVTLKGYFDHDGVLAEIGGPQYLGQLAASVVTIINVADYGRSIYDDFLRRQLIEIGTETVNDSYERGIDIEARQVIETAEKKLFDLATAGTAEGGFQAFRQAMKNAAAMAELAFKRSGKTSGVSSGFSGVDDMLGGLHPSDLLILAGRPSMGKTALATNIAFNVAKAYRAGHGPDGKLQPEDGGVVGFFSLEMSSEQLATRILAEDSGVSGDKIRKGEVGHEEFDAFVQATIRLENVPLFIDDTPALTISAVRTRARRLKRQHGLQLIVVDYLQLLHASARPGAEQNRVQEISEITRGLKALAKELEVPVIALSQLSRSVEQREDKRPQLSDLRESGSIEQDADVVMFVYRDEYYLNRTKPSQHADETAEKFNLRYENWFNRCRDAAGKAEVIIGKSRHGPIGTVTLHFDGAITKFSDFVGQDHLPDARY
ncbi:MAG TPA: replicative DNA helicase [Aliidongia sp.]|nr:replicative DNA helicase [Aliidongia sp.]